MKSLPFILLGLVLALHSVPAADAPPAPRKSSFVMDESGRNPFWPIGFKPTTKASANSTEHAAPDIMATAFVVTSITVNEGGDRFAIINGKPMSEGQAFGLQIGNQTYQVSVKRIEDGRVILRRRDQEIIVPLRRR